MNKTELLDRCGCTGEERTLLARVLDKAEQTRRREVGANTPFLSPAQRAQAEDLLARAEAPRHVCFGGYEGAERTVCLFLPQWQEPEDACGDPEGPLAAVEARCHPDAQLTHRDILGSLMGLGLTREKLGDILPGEGRFQVVALREAVPILLTQWESAGRWRLSCREIPLSTLEARAPQVRVIRDTVAALRLDAVAAVGFSLSRSKAAELVSAGRVEVNHRSCAKGDRGVEEGDVLTCRGLGKCVLKTVSGLSRKGRVMIEVERYL